MDNPGFYHGLPLPRTPVVRSTCQAVVIELLLLLLLLAKLGLEVLDLVLVLLHHVLELVAQVIDCQIDIILCACLHLLLLHVADAAVDVALNVDVVDHKPQ